MLYFLVLPDRIRMDRGTETGLMATIHSYLRAQCGDVDDGPECVFYGPSTQNKIEGMVERTIGKNGKGFS